MYLRPGTVILSFCPTGYFFLVLTLTPNTSVLFREPVLGLPDTRIFGGSTVTRIP